MDMVNDEFCDCEDGMDEPGRNTHGEREVEEGLMEGEGSKGTAACGKGVFWCLNRGFKGVEIPSSRVNDMVCDCCDGSDEWKSGVKCPDRCREEGAGIHHQIQEMLSAAQTGLQERTKFIQSGNAKRQQRESELIKLEVDLAIAVQEAEEARAEKEATEAQEKEENDRRAVLRAEWETKMNSSEPKEEPVADSAPPPVVAPQEAEHHPQVGEAGSAFPYPAEYAAPPSAEEDDASFPYPAEYAAPPEPKPSAAADAVASTPPPKAATPAGS